MRQSCYLMTVNNRLKTEGHARQWRHHLLTFGQLNLCDLPDRLKNIMWQQEISWFRRRSRDSITSSTPSHLISWFWVRFIVLVSPADINDNNFLPQQVAICLYSTYLSTGSTSFSSLCNEAHHCNFFYWVTLFLFVNFWSWWLHRGLPVYVFSVGYYVTCCHSSHGCFGQTTT